MINRVCDGNLMHAYQNQKKITDDHMVSYMAEHEVLEEKQKTINIKE